MQRSVEAVWNAWIDNIKSDLYHVIDETNSAMIISTGEYDVIRNSLRNSYPKDNKRIPHIVSELHDELAQERTDRDFGYYYHIVIEKTEKASLDEITDWWIQKQKLNSIVHITIQQIQPSRELLSVITQWYNNETHKKLKLRDD